MSRAGARARRRRQGREGEQGRAWWLWYSVAYALWLEQAPRLITGEINRGEATVNMVERLRELL